MKICHSLKDYLTIWNYGTSVTRLMFELFSLAFLLLKFNVYISGIYLSDMTRLFLISLSLFQWRYGLLG